MASRSLTLDGKITPRSAHKIIDGLKLFAKSSREPIKLFICSIGGDWDEAKKICNVILALKAPVVTIGLKTVWSSAATVFACGSLRLAFRRTVFGYHKISWMVDSSCVGYEIDEDDLIEIAKELRSCTKEYASYCVRRLPSHFRFCEFSTKQLLRRIIKSRKKKKDYVFLGEEAKRRGFADACIRRYEEIPRYEAILFQRRTKKR